MARLSAIMIMLLLSLGCRQHQEASFAEKQPAERIATEPQVIVPESVKSGWSAVELTVKDWQKKKTTEYRVAIGGSFVLPGSDLKIHVDTFLPNFILSADKATSRDSAAKNPAVLIRVSSENKLVFKGWLFALYPRAQSFSHPRYQLSLTGFIPTRQMAGKPSEKG